MIYSDELEIWAEIVLFCPYHQVDMYVNCWQLYIVENNWYECDFKHNMPVTKSFCKTKAAFLLLLEIIILSGPII